MIDLRNISILFEKKKEVSVVNYKKYNFNILKFQSRTKYPPNIENRIVAEAIIYRYFSDVNFAVYSS